jgi:hypothetical protein
MLTKVHLDNAGSGGASTAGEKQGDLGVLLSNTLVIRSDDPHQTGRGWGKIMKSSAGESEEIDCLWSDVGQIPADHLFYESSRTIHCAVLCVHAEVQARLTHFSFVGVFCVV